MSVVGRAIIQVDDIDFLEFAPLRSLSVQFRNPVCREVCDFYLDAVFSGLQECARFQAVRCCPYASCFLSVDSGSGFSYG